MSRLVAILACIAWVGPDPARADVDELAKLDEYYCGQTSLYVACRLLNKPVEWARIQSLLPPTKSGEHSFAEIAAAAESLGLHVQGVRATLDSFKQLPKPCIAHFHLQRGERSQRHFAVATDWNDSGVYVLDPPFPIEFVPWEGFEKVWTGYVLSVSDGASGAARSSVPPLLLRLVTWLGSLAATIAVVGAATSGAFRRVSVRSLRRWTESFRSHWKSVAAAACCGLLAVAIWSLYMPAQPLLACPTYLDLGSLSVGDHKFVVPIANRGRQPLAIGTIESSCTCTVVEKVGTVAAGGAGKLQVSLRVSPGSRNASLLIASNSSQGPHQLLLRWHAPTMPKLYPPLMTAVGSPGDRLVRTVNIVYPGGQSAVIPVIEGMDCPDERVRLKPLQNDPTAFSSFSPMSANRVVGYQGIEIVMDASKDHRPIEAKCAIHARYGDEQVTLTLPVRASFDQQQLGAVVFSCKRPAELVGQKRLIDLPVDAEVRISEAPPWLNCRIVGEKPAQGLECELLSAPPENPMHGTIALFNGKHGRRVMFCWLD